MVVCCRPECVVVFGQDALEKRLYAHLQDRDVQRYDILHLQVWGFLESASVHLNLGPESAKVPQDGQCINEERVIGLVIHVYDVLREAVSQVVPVLVDR